VNKGKRRGTYLSAFLKKRKRKNWPHPVMALTRKGETHHSKLVPRFRKGPTSTEEYFPEMKGGQSSGGRGPIIVGV